MSRATTPIATLIEELKSDDAKRRINSIKSLPIIANVIGPERTRSELLPFVTELLDDNDEVLINLSEAFGELNDYIGGNNYTHLLLNPLEKLCYVEELAVRNKAIQTMKKLLPLIDFKKHEDTLIQFMKKMANGDYESVKASACAIIPSIYQLSSPQSQNDLRQ